MIIKDCDNVTTYYRGHGNRTNQTDNQACHLVGIHNVAYIRAPMSHAREVSCDVLYVVESDWMVKSAPPNHVELGQVIVSNTADYGRNAVAVISVEGMVIESLVSYQVGGIVQGRPM